MTPYALISIIDRGTSKSVGAAVSLIVHQNKKLEFNSDNFVSFRIIDKQSQKV
jgi:hypothetical protein